MRNMHCIYTTVLKCTLHGFQDTLYATFFFLQMKTVKNKINKKQQPSLVIKNVLRSNRKIKFFRSNRE